MLEEYRRNWYRFEDLCSICGFSSRTGRDYVQTLSASIVREELQERGAPRKLYHYTAHPRLAAHHLHQSETAAAKQPAPVAEPAADLPVSVAPDDLAVATMRLHVVRHYEALKKSMPEHEAALATCREYRRRPLCQSGEVVDRLPGNHQRKRRWHVTVGAFKPSTVRLWARVWREQGELLSLAPRRKSACGAAREPSIPPDLVQFVWALCTSTARAAVTSAVAEARRHWPGDFPQVHISTWQRAIKRHDPRKGGKDLNHSVSRFRENHSPDIEIDWSLLPYNGRWEIDDVQKDWYAHASDVQKIIRPYAYAILRARTRQWVALVTSEEPITQEQIRTLVGASMASSSGGIPEVIKFERGHVASDPHLEWILGLLDVRVSRTSMDGGAVFDGALADRASGHFQGKPLVEANFRKQHNIEWMMPGQVGPEERHTAPARTETLKRLAAERARQGGFLILPQPAEWHAIARQTCETHNTTPHGGLPLIVDPSTGEARHMTPNECAQSLRDSEVRVMDSRYLPLFSVRGERLPVTRNGVRIGNETYGRYDDDLLAMEFATIYVNPDASDLAYCWELGRVIERYDKAAPGDDEQFGRKRGVEKRFRNRYRAAVASAAEILQNGTLLVDAVQLTSDPTPQRRATVITSAILAERAAGLTRAVADHRQRRVALDRRTRFDSSPAPQPASMPGSRRTSGIDPICIDRSAGRRRSLLSRAGRLAGALETVAANNPTPTEDAQCQPTDTTN